jgi:hypothetical protein
MTMSVSSRSYGPVVQRRLRLVTVGADADAVSGALQRPAEEAAHRAVVFGEEDAGHGNSDGGGAEHTLADPRKPGVKPGRAPTR